MILRLVMFVIVMGIASGCGDGTLPFSQYDKVDVNVYFYFPDDREIFLGETRGASSCGDMAHNYAATNKLSRSSKWSYICCTIEKGSSCYRKIR